MWLASRTSAQEHMKKRATITVAVAAGNAINQKWSKKEG